MWGRDALVADVERLLGRGHHVLLFGAKGVGKSTLIGGLSPELATLVLDPFEHVTPRSAARIRQAMDRGAVCLAAARSLDRAVLGAVRRIAWRFTTVRVAPLADRWMRTVVSDECERLRVPGDAVTPAWIQSAVRASRGCPGLAVALVREAVSKHAASGVFPSPAAAAIEARIRQMYASRYPEPRRWR
jgi:hypothetical protein